MGKTRAAAVVLDAGALIAFERADPRMRALLREAQRVQVKVVIPAGALGQAWRDSARQVALRALANDPLTSVPPLDRVLAEAAGVLCGRTRTSDVVDASVALAAKRENAVVITSDPDNLRRLDPTLRIEPI